MARDGYRSSRLPHTDPLPTPPPDSPTSKDPTSRGTVAGRLPSPKPGWGPLGIVSRFFEDHPGWLLAVSVLIIGTLFISIPLFCVLVVLYGLILCVPPARPHPEDFVEPPEIVDPKPAEPGQSWTDQPDVAWMTASMLEPAAPPARKPKKRTTSRKGARKKK
jgi:hypothetical protein